ncbi:hypothetical protein SUGI_0846500 [Cryptomeria japonica]|nr:hypothetical protein SUGI_0846500 [Cryptomeria japonica]
MDVAFKEFINIIMVVYQDDLTYSSKRADDHCGHLEFGVSLNPKKCHFGVTEGKLLGHIVSKEGVRIDPERIEAINKVSKPKNVKVAAVLLQKDNEGYEHPIAFYSKSLQAVELKYETMEKKAYALVKVVKAFRPYLVNANIIAYVPHAVVKDILSQSEVIGKRCRWINRIQEIDLEIKITKLAKQVLTEMHDGVCGGHYSRKTIAGKIILAGYYCPTLFKDTHAYVRKCDPCQKFSSKLKYEGALPLNPVFVEAPFVQWGIDFIEEIVERSGRGHRWIIVATDYFTKWIEAIPTRRATSKVVIDFLMDNVVTRFGVPTKLVMDNAMCFRSEEFVGFCTSHGILMSYSSPYHP